MDDEVRLELEEIIREEQKKLKSLPNGSKEKQIQADVVQKLISSYNQSEQTVGDWFDKQERRRIDEEKNKRLSDIEEKKTKMSGGKVALEVIKCIAPVVGAVVSTLFCIGASKRELDETLEFEENGRIVSSAGRSHKRPSFWNKK